MFDSSSSSFVIHTVEVTWRRLSETAYRAWSRQPAKLEDHLANGGLLSPFCFCGTTDPRRRLASTAVGELPRYGERLLEQPRHHGVQIHIFVLHIETRHDRQHTETPLESCQVVTYCFTKRSVRKCCQPSLWFRQGRLAFRGVFPPMRRPFLMQKPTATTLIYLILGRLHHRRDCNRPSTLECNSRV